MLLSGIWFKYQIPDKALGNDSLKAYVHIVPISRQLIITMLQAVRDSTSRQHIVDILSYLAYIRNNNVIMEA
jgi:hypothetical protein